MIKRRFNFWLGFLIGFFNALLALVIVIMLVPSLHHLIGDKTGPVEPVSINNQQVAPQIIVDAPSGNQDVASPLRVSGKAIAFESVINIRITDDDGNILAETFASTDAREAGEFGAFEVDVPFLKNQATRGALEVFEKAARDGSEINKVTVPITFK